jgi:hypothetical protein
VAFFCSAIWPSTSTRAWFRLSSLWREAGKLVTEVGAAKRRVLVDRARKEAFAQRTERDEPDPKFLKRRQQLAEMKQQIELLEAEFCKDGNLAEIADDPLGYNGPSGKVSR